MKMYLFPNRCAKEHLLLKEYGVHKFLYGFTISSTKTVMIYIQRNPASAFQIRLPTTNVSTKYGMALAEITYPHAWSTFNYIEDYILNCSDIQSNVHILKNPHGYYKTMADIVSKLNETIVDHEDCQEN